MDTLEAIDNTLTDLIVRAEKLNEKDAPTRSRELSLTITKLEEARHWLAETLVAV